MACGGITLGLLQAFQDIRFGDLIAGILAQFFGALVLLFLGGAGAASV